MELHDLAAQGQADARPGVRLAVVEPLEDDEDPLRELRFDADAVVAAAQVPHGPLAAGRAVHLGRGVRAELERVADQVLERSDDRRVGQECVRTSRSRWSPYH